MPYKSGQMQDRVENVVALEIFQSTSTVQVIIILNMFCANNMKQEICNIQT